jgi:hypothetical protein
MIRRNLVVLDEKSILLKISVAKNPALIEQNQGHFRLRASKLV